MLSSLIALCRQAFPRLFQLKIPVSPVFRRRQSRDVCRNGRRFCLTGEMKFDRFQSGPTSSRVFVSLVRFQTYRNSNHGTSWKCNSVLVQHSQTTVWDGCGWEESHGLSEPFAVCTFFCCFFVSRPRQHSNPRSIRFTHALLIVHTEERGPARPAHTCGRRRTREAAHL